MKIENSVPLAKMNMILNTLLEKIFTGLDPETIQQIYETGNHMEFKTGEYLFQQGENRHEMYIVLSGRLRAISKEGNISQILGDIGAGETVGELAFFSDEPRMASVLAIRDSVVLEFTPDQYLKLVVSKPQLAKSLIKLVIGRLRRNAFESKKSTPPKNISIIHLQPENDISTLTTGLKNYFAEKGIPLKVYDSQSLIKNKRDQIFISLEQNEGLNLLFCDDLHIEWTIQCLIYADLIIVATDFYAKTDIYPIEEELNLYSGTILNKKTYLLLLHPENPEKPKNTDAWLKGRSVDMHIHLRLSHIGDIQRFCRILTHKANGLVLGGGGAKGFAHIGVVKALNEAGIPIDFVGGTSAGALYGLGMSFFDFDFGKIYKINIEAVKRKLTSGDLSWPILSLKSGKKFKSYLKYMFEEYHLEDFWLISYCVSANLSNASIHVHNSGTAWKQIFASMAIPGVFPPVLIDKHLHVDGGVMDNLPIDPMYRYPVDRIFAVSLSNLNVQEIDLTDLPGSWKLLKDRVFGGKSYNIPGIASLIVNSLTINSQQRQEIAKEKVSDYIALELQDVGLLDDKNWKEIMDKGYQQTRQYLDSVARKS